MSDFKQTQTYFDKIIKTAREHIIIFCGNIDASFWTDKTKGLLFKRSLTDRLNSFLQKTDTHTTLEVIYRPNGHNEILLEKIHTPADAYFLPLTDLNFIKPLNGIAEAFIVADKKNSFISSNHETDTGIYTENNPGRSTFILNIFYQLMRHEAKIAHNLPTTTDLLNLEKAPAVYENINAIMKHHNSPIQTLRRKNPFVNRILNNQNQL